MKLFPDTQVKCWQKEPSKQKYLQHHPRTGTKTEANATQLVLDVNTRILDNVSHTFLMHMSHLSVRRNVGPFSSAHSSGEALGKTGSVLRS